MNILSASELYSEIRLKQYVLYSVIVIIIKKIRKKKKQSKAKDFHLVLFLDVKKKKSLYFLIFYHVMHNKGSI